MLSKRGLVLLLPTPTPPFVYSSSCPKILNPHQQPRPRRSSLHHSSDLLTVQAVLLKLTLHQSQSGFFALRVETCHSIQPNSLMVEAEDDDKADSKSTFKIHSPARHALAAALLRLASGSSSPMKAVRPLFTILLLSVVAAAILTCRFSIPISAVRADSIADLPLFNSTLLKLAESDPGEDRLRQEIDQLIEGNFDKLARYRPFLLWRRFTAAADLRARTSRGVPVSLRSPAFYRLYLQFRTLLSDWSRRRKRSRRHTAENDVFSDLLPLIGRRKKYSSCAVVGNSGILLNAEHGAAIDGHEAVIRLNNARIEGYAKKVGSKTTISFVNSNILHLCARRKDCFCHPYGADVRLVLYICQPIHFLDFAACNATTSTDHRAPIFVTDPKFDLLCAKIVKYYSLKRWFGAGGSDRNRSLEGWSKAHDGMMFHYSSGMQAVVMTAGVCERVSLYGFGKAATAKHHYHTNQKAELQLHDYEAEYEFYKDLMERPHVIPFLSFTAEFQFPAFQICH